MFLRKVSGPRMVTLPDGTRLSRADLPPPGTRRWVVSRKVAVVKGVVSGLINREEACAMYGLSDEELDSWIAAARVHGPEALKVTRLQKFRQP